MTQDSLVAAAPPLTAPTLARRVRLFVALGALLLLLLMPAAKGLPPAEQAMLAILAFYVNVWLTEALNYAVSAVVIGALITLLAALALPLLGQLQLGERRSMQQGAASPAC